MAGILPGTASREVHSLKVLHNIEKINTTFPLNNVWPLQENSGGFVHSFTRRQTETGALTKVADRGKVHSVAGSRFTVAVLRADYQVTSVSSGPAFRFWWHLTPASAPLELQSNSTHSKTFFFRPGFTSGHVPLGSLRGCPPFTFTSSGEQADVLIASQERRSIKERRLKTRISITKHVT